MNGTGGQHKMYNRWSVKDKAALHALYQHASKEHIMKVIPNRSWRAICETAYYYGLHRSYAAKGEAIRRGLNKKYEQTK